MKSFSLKRALLVFILWGCATDETEVFPEQDSAETEIVEWKVTPAGNLEMHSELLSSGVSKALLSEYRIAAHSGAGWQLRDPTLLEALAIPEGVDLTHLIALPSEQILLYADQGTWLMSEGSFSLSPFADQLPYEILRTQSDDLGVWIQSSQGLHRYQEGFLGTIQLEGSALTGLFQTGAVFSDMPGIWVEGEDKLVLLAGPSHQAVRAVSVDSPLQQLSLNKKQELWVQGEDNLVWHRSEEWLQPVFEESVIDIKGNPNAPGTWIRLETHVLYHLDGEFWTVEVPEGDWLDVDGAGRLILLSEIGELLRVSPGPKLGLLNFPRRALDQTRTVTLDPSDADQVNGITVTIGGEAQELTDRPWQVYIDPVALGDGQFELEASVSYQSGEVEQFLDSFNVDLGVVKWEEDIEPFSISTCLMCHGGSSLTVLDSKDAWVEHIDLILQVVISGEMPQGGPVLDADQINMIQQWKDGDFQ